MSRIVKTDDDNIITGRNSVLELLNELFVLTNCADAVVVILNKQTIKNNLMFFIIYMQKFYQK